MHTGKQRSLLMGISTDGFSLLQAGFAFLQVLFYSFTLSTPRPWKLLFPGPLNFCWSYLSSSATTTVPYWWTNYQNRLQTSCMLQSTTAVHSHSVKMSNFWFLTALSLISGHTGESSFTPLKCTPWHFYVFLLLNIRKIILYSIPMIWRGLSLTWRLTSKELLLNRQKCFYKCSTYPDPRCWGRQPPT